MRYLKGTAGYGLHYQKSDEIELTGWADSDWGGDLSTGKSCGGYAIFLGSCLIAWKSKRQRTVMTSTMAAELDSLYQGVIEGIYIEQFLKQIGVKLKKPMIWYQDNQSAIKTVESEKNSERAKFMLIKIHFLKEVFQSGRMRLKYCSTKEMKADFFTKAPPAPSFGLACNELGTADVTRLC